MEFSEHEVKEIMYQAISAIAFLHKSNLMHRDVKPENFLVVSNEDGGPVSRSVFSIGIKLADFGLVRSYKDGRTNPFTDYVSTRWYRSPELCFRSTNYNEKIDVYALGCTMAELFL